MKQHTHQSPPLSLEELQQEISGHAFMAEEEAVTTLMPLTAPYEKLAAAIQKEARGLVEDLRENGAGSGVEAFLHEYGLETKEGVAVMCLAEALLRIPDAETANRLIRDKFEDAEWEEHIGRSDSLFVNASSWGLLLTGSVINFAAEKKENPAGVFRKMVGRVGAPVVREALKTAMHIIGSQFVLGENIDEALKRAAAARKKGYRHSFDILGEGARTAEQADSYFSAYKQAITAIGKTVTADDNLYTAPSLSIKLSALHPRYWLMQDKRLHAELLPRLRELALMAQQQGMAVAIDAEEATRLDVEMGLFAALRCDPELAEYDGIGFVLQAYQKRGLYVIKWLKELARQSGKRIAVRLVKGAYWDSEIKYAQQQGLAGYPVFTRKEYTDLSYLACAQELLANSDKFFPQFATHNALTLSQVKILADDMGLTREDYEFQRLHGMGEKLYDKVLEDVNCRIYAPVGRHKDLLAYLIRRLLENGANTSFVNLLMDRDTSIRKVLEDPIALARKNMGKPAAHIPLPRDIYGDRDNSRGFDTGNSSEMAILQRELAHFAGKSWRASPTLLNDATAAAAAAADVTNPADNTDIVGQVVNADPQMLQSALAAAQDAFYDWENTAADERAAMLEKTALLMERDYYELIALLIREAGKTIPDAIAEVREAVDFCRYYAQQARKIFAVGAQKLPSPTGEDNRLSLHGRGVWLAISPWNFPLAIFTGQVVAALVTGNCVLAKPAGQTPLIAAFAVRLMHEAGIPQAVVQLVPGGGKDVGEVLVKSEDIAGVVFTGSTATARHINRTLAARDGAIVPLIAETGGQNCMIVDSSALLEQVTDDVIISAFNSAGQRCSALRVLFVQEEIADELTAMIKGAMAELTIGDPAELATDVGPVIDKYAQGGLLKHIGRMKKQARLLATAELPEEWEKAGTFVAPHMFAIDNIDQLTEEQFGPILHVVRYQADKLAEVTTAINSTGFGLTCGIQSRIESNYELLRPLIKAGNAYINRNMTGAVVGVQPFGGEGLSGTGPKAGGPHYLLRFVVERTTTINTTAIGGNLELLSGGS